MVGWGLSAMHVAYPSSGASNNRISRCRKWLRPFTLGMPQNLGIQASSGILAVGHCKLSFSMEDLTVGTFPMLPVRPLKSPELIDTLVRAYKLTPKGDPI